MKSCVIALVPLLAFTVSARGRFNVPDSHLDAHPPVPDIVSRGRKPDVPGCGSCHLPNGFGRPENASLAGLPAVYIAYVPVGSIKRGEALVTTGAGGRTVRCALCHADDLKGLGSAPGLAGRSPSYVVRQLYDMQHGARHGVGADLMKATVARLNKDDMISIAAYTASRAP